MTAQAPVKLGGIGRFRLGVNGIYGIEMKRGRERWSASLPLIITVLL